MKSTYMLIMALLAPFVLLGQWDSIYFDNSYRDYLVHLPTSYDGSVATPVILGFHGAFGRADQFEEQSLLSDKSDQAGFIAVYPNGTGFNLAPELRFWNAGTCCGYPYLNNIDDVGYVSALIDSLAAQFNVDTTRIYATGMSNGAMMAYRLGCELSDKIAAIAPVAGGLLTASPCVPSRPVPVVHFHSYIDSSNVYYGGVGNGASDHHNPPVDSIMDVFSALNNCTIIRDTIHSGVDYTHFRFSNCDCSVEQQVFVTEDGGHSWPGGTSPPLGDPVSTVINANDEMWDLFLQHSLDCLPSSVPELKDLLFRIYPNPSSGTFTIDGSNEILGNTAEVWDMSGRVILSFQMTSSKQQVDLQLEQGAYVVSVVYESTRLNRMIIVE